MLVQGNLRKMATELTSSSKALYNLRLYDILEPAEQVDLNQLVGEKIKISFDGQINCVVSGQQIKKTFGEGMSYEAFKNSPMAVPSIIRPELSRIHEGIALRDEEWEKKHHLTPHCVYLSKTSTVKVGVTRKTQVPYRWIDQGAVEAMVIAETPYRQAAGLIEVALKDYISDKTSWQKMLKNEQVETDLEEAYEYLEDYIPADAVEFLKTDHKLTKIEYPVIEYPTKVKSLKLDSSPVIEKKLMGIKGQYLMFEDGTVLNIRSHSGYKIALEY